MSQLTAQVVIAELKSNGIPYQNHNLTPDVPLDLGSGQVVYLIPESDHVIKCKVGGKCANENIQKLLPILEKLGNKSVISNTEHKEAQTAIFNLLNAHKSSTVSTGSKSREYSRILTPSEDDRGGQLTFNNEGSTGETFDDIITRLKGAENLLNALNRMPERGILLVGGSLGLGYTTLEEAQATLNSIYPNNVRETFVDKVREGGSDLDSFSKTNKVLLYNHSHYNYLKALDVVMNRHSDGDFKFTAGVAGSNPFVCAIDIINNKIHVYNFGGPNPKIKNFTPDNLDPSTDSPAPTPIITEATAATLGSKADNPLTYKETRDLPTSSAAADPEVAATASTTSDGRALPVRVGDKTRDIAGRGKAEVRQRPKGAAVNTGNADGSSGGARRRRNRKSRKNKAKKSRKARSRSGNSARKSRRGRGRGRRTRRN